jgi:hypothetical protein
LFVARLFPPLFVARLFPPLFVARLFPPLFVARLFPPLFVARPLPPQKGMPSSRPLRSLAQQPASAAERQTFFALARSTL